MLGLENTVVEAVEEQDGAIVISVRPHARQLDRCPALSAALPWV